MCMKVCAITYNFSRSASSSTRISKELIFSKTHNFSYLLQSNSKLLPLFELQMSTTTMHFGPEWMRTKPQPTSRTQPPPSPPPASASASAASTYSSLLSSTTAPPADSKDQAHPFRYSKEEMLRIYREGGGKGGLGLEVERWEGVVRETGIEPIGIKEMGEAEKKASHLFKGSSFCFYSGSLSCISSAFRYSAQFRSPSPTID